MKHTNEASLEPLSDKEVNDFLERQRRAREDSKWATAKTIKEIKKEDLFTKEEMEELGIDP